MVALAAPRCECLYLVIMDLKLKTPAKERSQGWNLLGKNGAFPQLLGGKEGADSAFALSSHDSPHEMLPGAPHTEDLSSVF